MQAMCQNKKVCISALNCLFLIDKNSCCFYHVFASQIFCWYDSPIGGTFSIIFVPLSPVKIKIQGNFESALCVMNFIIVKTFLQLIIPKEQNIYCKFAPNKPL